VLVLGLLVSNSVQTLPSRSHTTYTSKWVTVVSSMIVMGSRDIVVWRRVRPTQLLFEEFGCQL
jgi:hypothetical protein